MSLGFTLAGQHFHQPLILAPMAGVTDRPFRQLCQQLGGVDLVVAEMISADPSLLDTRKSRLRRDHTGERGLRWIQIVGGEAASLAAAAQFNVAAGADIIDINMGCPAKKVCKKQAGSALMKDERLVAELLTAVVQAVSVPVTLKTRIGWDKAALKNGVRIAKIAQDCGIQLLSMHGRSRACKFQGDAEYDTIAETKQALSIPVIANGDIDAPEKAAFVLDYTRADGLMIGRGAQGNPWLFQQIRHYLDHRTPLRQPELNVQHAIITQHLQQLHSFYGVEQGVKIARKHIGWYLNAEPDEVLIAARGAFNQVTTPEGQQEWLRLFFETKHCCWPLGDLD